MIVKDAISRFATEILDHLDREVEIPVVTEVACQGDVSIVRVNRKPANTVVPAAGVAVVRGENGGNTHSLHGDGSVYFDRDNNIRELLLGVLTVPADAVAVLAHPEHGFMQIAPGTYEIGRQREFAGEWRMVAD